uniref:Protein kinase domain-containing protein n=1 Tax=Oryza glaberrima TaxID=4538 RepID=I1QSQ4_ORYGL
IACKRPAPDGGDAFLAAASPCCKKPRPLFTSIFNYEYLHKLGAGSYGVVYKARDRRTGETVAVKWGDAPRRHGAPRHQAGQHPRRPGLCAQDLRLRDGHDGAAAVRAVHGRHAPLQLAGAAHRERAERQVRRQGRGHVGGGLRDGRAPHRRQSVHVGDGEGAPPGAGGAERLCSL